MRVEQEAQAKQSVFDTFDDYVSDYPEGERWRHMVDAGEVLLATYEGQSCLEGDYYICWAYDHKHYKTGMHDYGVCVNNGDDGYMRKKCNSLREAQEELEQLKSLAPFYSGDLLEFGYYYD